MDQVPKILKPLVNEWTPEGYIVSFKVGALVPLRRSHPRIPWPGLYLTSIPPLSLCYLARDRFRTPHPQSQSRVGTLWPPGRHWQ